jgi:hypothetical protein
MGRMSEIDHILRTSKNTTKELNDYFKFIHPEWSVEQVYTTTLYFKKVDESFDRLLKKKPQNDREST